MLEGLHRAMARRRRALRTIGPGAGKITVVDGALALLELWPRMLTLQHRLAGPPVATTAAATATPLALARRARLAGLTLQRRVTRRPWTRGAAIAGLSLRWQKARAIAATGATRALAAPRRATIVGRCRGHRRGAKVEWPAHILDDRTAGAMSRGAMMMTGPVRARGPRIDHHHR
jgi:hypothetical protein